MLPQEALDFPSTLSTDASHIHATIRPSLYVLGTETARECSGCNTTVHRSWPSL